MRFGVHVSAAGGLDRAPERAANLGCETMQIFVSSNRQWTPRPLVAALSAGGIQTRAPWCGHVGAPVAALPKLGDRQLDRLSASVLRRGSQ